MPPQPDPVSANLQARSLIVHGSGGMPPALDIMQEIVGFPVPSPVVPGSSVTIVPRNVGLWKRLILEISGTFNAGATSTQALTKIGLANLLSSVQFTDFSSYQRIQTWGPHLHIVSSAKRRRVFGSAGSLSDPCGFTSGSVWGTITAPASIAANGNGAFRMFYEIPIAAGDQDLTGAMFADLTQAQAQLTITFNPNMFVASGSDATNAIYQSAGADLATMSGVTIRCYQNYLDQLPQANGAYILPQIDIASAYLLNKATSSAGLVAGQDNSYPFLNNRRYQSAYFVYDNGGVLNPGSDINYIEVISANLLPIKKVDPSLGELTTRNIFGADIHAGGYYWDFRHRPVDTSQFGNWQLIVNPISVGVNSSIQYGFESTGLLGLVQGAGSLPSGGG